MTSSTAPNTVPHPQTHTPHPQTATDIQPAVNLTHLTKSFGDLRAVDGLDLSIRPGEVVAFLGPNGAGKTTTIDMLLGLSRPDEGSVEIFGMPPRRAVALGLVSSVMQTGGLLDDLTLRETVDYTSAIFASSLDTDVVLERAGGASVTAGATDEPSASAADDVAGAGSCALFSGIDRIASRVAELTSTGSSDSAASASTSA
ncbi:ABC transporter [Brevibacterium iodinum ATCC 49514]|uniref:ABC transporter n=1 Tax=Brevibacterium iodinum ATCC 49514 TaxID=1255616 RepID=A0A2H1KAC5_9MICO|nr:ABC transporter [Brevibacterium iodinum ATCC 49514]SUW13999.1 Uncharacterized ABC transporter ATP-binding protein YbhF [Brevibacterium iodinum]